MKNEEYVDIFFIIMLCISISISMFTFVYNNKFKYEKKLDATSLIKVDYDNIVDAVMFVYENNRDIDYSDRLPKHGTNFRILDPKIYENTNNNDEFNLQILPDDYQEDESSLKPLDYKDLKWKSLSHMILDKEEFTPIEYDAFDTTHIKNLPCQIACCDDIKIIKQDELNKKMHLDDIIMKGSNYNDYTNNIKTSQTDIKITDEKKQGYTPTSNIAHEYNYAFEDSPSLMSNNKTYERKENIKFKKEQRQLDKETFNLKKH